MPWRHMVHISNGKRPWYGHHGFHIRFHDIVPGFLDMEANAAFRNRRRLHPPRCGVGKREGNGSLDALQQIGYIKPYRLPLYIGTHIVSDIAPIRPVTQGNGHCVHQVHIVNGKSVRRCHNAPFVGPHGIVPGFRDVKPNAAFREIRRLDAPRYGVGKREGNGSLDALQTVGNP